VVNLCLTAEQARLLRQTLESVLSDMSVEIASTDRKEYRDEIKDEREALREVLNRLDDASREPGRDCEPEPAPI